MVPNFLMCHEYSFFNLIPLFYIGMRSGGSNIPRSKAMLRDACFPEGMPSFLGKLEWGCQKA